MLTYGLFWKGEVYSMIAPISGFGSLGTYRISSIHGNPNSMQPIDKIGEQTDKQGKPLVIAQKEQEEQLYIKDYGELKPTTQMESGAFAAVLEMQAGQWNQAEQKNDSNTSMDYYNDMIGMMGFENRIRDQLTGMTFEPF